MKQENVYQPFLFSSFQHSFSITLSDLRWKAFENHDFMGDGEDWALLMQNFLSEKNPALLERITFGEETLMFCINSADKVALHEVAELVFAFYEDDALLDACITRYAQYDFEPELAS